MSLSRAVADDPSSRTVPRTARRGWRRPAPWRSLSRGPSRPHPGTHAAAPCAAEAGLQHGVKGPRVLLCTYEAAAACRYISPAYLPLHPGTCSLARCTTTGDPGHPNPNPSPIPNRNPNRNPNPIPNPNPVAYDQSANLNPNRSPTPTTNPNPNQVAYDQPSHLLPRSAAATRLLEHTRWRQSAGRLGWRRGAALGLLHLVRRRGGRRRSTACPLSQPGHRGRRGPHGDSGLPATVRHRRAGRGVP